MVEMHLGEEYRHVVKAKKAHAHSVWLYWCIFLALLFLTFITVWLSQFDFGSLSVFVTLLIASTKALLVLAFFMHLWFDSKFYALTFGVTLIFLSLFVLFPILDIGSRSYLDSFKADFVPRDEKVYEYEQQNPNALPLRPGLLKPEPDKLIFEGPEVHE